MGDVRLFSERLSVVHSSINVYGTICTLFVFLCTSADAQLVAQPSTALVVPTDPSFIPLLNDNFAQCPFPTEHVSLPIITETYGQYPGVSEINRFSIGCCPNQTFACTDQNDNRIYGCYANISSLVAPNQGVPVTPVCCYNSNQRVIGSAVSALQCCDDTICTDGQLCCGGSCCQKPTTNAGVNETCRLDVNTSAPINCSDASYQASLVNCTVPSYNVVCSSLVGVNGTVGCPWCPVNQTNCSFPTAGLFAVSCPTQQNCVYYTKVIQQCPSQWVGCTNGVSLFQVPVGCSNNLVSSVPDACTTLLQTTPTYVGDRRPGQTCCGPYICEAGMKCCSRIINTTTVQGNQTNTTVYDGCCPISLDSDLPITCCNNNIMDPSDTRKAANWFCGGISSSVPGNQCEVDKLRPPAYYARASLNRLIPT